MGLGTENGIIEFIAIQTMNTNVGGYLKRKYGRRLIF